jgi:ankyrin repeat protein
MQVARQLWLAAERGDVAGIEAAATDARAMGMNVSEAVHASVNGGSALHWAAKEGHVAAARCLLDSGAQVNGLNHGQQAPLHWAAAKGQVHIIPILVRAGGNVNARDTGGWTPLHMAAYRGKVAAVVCLCENGSNVSAADLEGDTALHMTAYSGHASAAQALLERGVDPYARNVAGQSALDLALEGGPECEELVDLLEETNHFHERARLHGHRDFSLRTYVHAPGKSRGVNAPHDSHRAANPVGLTGASGDKEEEGRSEEAVQEAVSMEEAHEEGPAEAGSALGESADD